MSLSTDRLAVDQPTPLSNPGSKKLVNMLALRAESSPGASGCVYTTPT